MEKKEKKKKKKMKKDFENKNEENENENENKEDNKKQKAKPKNLVERHRRVNEIHKLPEEKRLEKYIQNVISSKEERLKIICEKCWLLSIQKGKCMCDQLLKEKEKLPFIHNLVFLYHHKEYLR